MSGPVILLIVVVLAIVIVGAVISYKVEQQRRLALQSLAQRLGLQFDPESNYSPGYPYDSFSAFTRGHSHRAYNTISGHLTIESLDCSLWMGDYLFKETSGSGKDRRTTTYHLSYLILQLPFTSIPALSIRPEGIFDKLAGVFGFSDINFESAEFSRRFHVKCENERFAYDIIDPRMMEFLLAAQPLPIQINANLCCVTNASGRWKPEQFEQQIRFAQEFFSRWPEHVVKSLRSAGNYA